jgi:hypothetical protein
MKVKELIAKLQRQEPEMPVHFGVAGDWSQPVQKICVTEHPIDPKRYIVIIEVD